MFPSWSTETLVPYGFPPPLKIASSVYPGVTTIQPQWYIVVYRDRIVASWPPWEFCAEVIALATLLANFPSAHSPPVVSRNCFIWEGTFPKRVGMLNM